MKSRSLLLGILLAAAAGCAAAQAASDRAFEQAAASYRAARYSDAFGRLAALAAEGDADAARIVLFMHQYGPMLYGSYWDLNGEQVAHFTRLSASAKARSAPPFVPLQHGPAPARPRPREVVRISGK